jgi:hypothetical protein
MSDRFDEVFAQKQEKYRKQYPGKNNKFGVDMLARTSADRHFRESGDANFVRNAPLMNDPAGRDSIESDAGVQQSNLAGAQPNVSAPVQAGQSDADYFSTVFGKAGGIGGDPRAAGDDDAEAGTEVAPESAPKKQGWGTRIWNGLKGLGGMLKNASGYNLIRHGLFGANFRRGKARKNAAKKEALTKQIASAAPGSSEMKRLQSEFNVADHKLFTNQAKLGQHRQYYTGRKMANEFSSAFSGKHMGMRDENKPFFNGDISQQDDDDTASEGSSSQSLSERRPSPAPMEPQRQASLPKAPMKDDRWNVVQAQQQHGSNDDLQYDAYGNVIFE